MSKLKAPLVFDAKIPAKIKLIPLFGKEEVDAHSLVSSLRKEADEIRKEKKRNKLSGVHKYVFYLVIYFLLLIKYMVNSYDMKMWRQIFHLLTGK
ncbi:leucine-rich repeat-containing protein 47-like [Octopus bimaculoides]|uniref:leucine-rich repeat-containing protein 47-like n=1 Tax=Octopus bimaculoides TaxID=37653 RepID=UPI0022E16F96|nr:leucine-rich repeat-containing protein 47-like [Octopus bimaculoides]